MSGKSQKSATNNPYRGNGVQAPLPQGNDVYQNQTKTEFSYGR